MILPDLELLSSYLKESTTASNKEETAIFVVFSAHNGQLVSITGFPLTYSMIHDLQLPW